LSLLNIELEVFISATATHRMRRERALCFFRTLPEKDAARCWSGYKKDGGRRGRASVRRSDKVILFNGSCPAAVPVHTGWAVRIQSRGGGSLARSVSARISSNALSACSNALASLTFVILKSLSRNGHGLHNLAHLEPQAHDRVLAPYGHNQWISIMETDWATSALALAIDRQSPSSAAKISCTAAAAP
jgi:hypothetical protein